MQATDLMIPVADTAEPAAADASAPAVPEADTAEPVETSGTPFTPVLMKDRVHRITPENQVEAGHHGKGPNDAVSSNPRTVIKYN